MKSKQFLTGRKRSAFAPSRLDKHAEKLYVFCLLAILFLVVLSGCGATPVDDSDFTPTPVTFTIVVPYKCGQPPAVSMVIMRDVVWDFITLDDEDLVTTTVDGYKALGLNTSDWIAASFAMKEQRNFYRDCIKRSQKEIHDENLGNGLVPSLPGE